MKPMLASKWEDRNETMFPLYGQPKFDGIRVLVREGYAYTRSLKPVRSTIIQSAIRKYKHVLDGLDGELIVGEPTAPDCYVRTNSAVMSYDNPDAENFKFYVFDRWDSDLAFRDRYSRLGADEFGWPNFCKLAETVLLENIQELQSWEISLLLQGHEGLILRHPDRKYKFGRGTPKEGQLIKKKQWIDLDGQITTTYEQMHNSNEATINELGYTERSGHKANLIPMNKLGSLEVTAEFKGTSVSVRVGSGFKDEERVRLWQQRNSLIGKWIKFKYFPVGSKDKHRFPIFLGFRDTDDMDQQQGSLL